MGVDIGGAFTIAGVSGTQALKIAGASEAFRIDTTGRTYYPNQIGFQAGYASDPGWWAQPSGWTVWNYQNHVPYNVGGGFSGGRFTAPVAGAYLFHWTCYHYKPSAVPGNYIHPMLWINGTDQANYRFSAYWTPAGYSFDSDLTEMLYLNVGDYVDVHIYFSAAGMSGYPAHSHFDGWLVG